MRLFLSYINCLQGLIFAFFKFDLKAIFFYDFVGLLFPLLKFSCCMVLMTELFLKALTLVAMNISQSFFVPPMFR